MALTLDDAGRQYAELRTERDAGRLGQAEFVAAVQALQAQDAQGQWWTLDPDTGGWLYFDGSSWAPQQARMAPPCPHCGAALQPGDGFCTACGKSPTQAAPAPAPAPPPAWQQPAPIAPPAYGYQQPQYANNSGTGGPAPPEVQGWNWGAFFWSWLWGIANGVWISLLICMLGLIGAIWLGVKGSEMAWGKRRFDSVQQFKDTQRAWATWGWVFFALNLVLGVIAALAIPAMIAAGQLDPDMFNF